MKQNYTKATFANERPKKRKKTVDHLTQDVLDAEAAGMSYGQYKAMHPHTYTTEDYEEPEAEEDSAPDPGPGQPATRTCVHCGKEFLVARWAANKMYCSDECRLAAARARDKELHPEKYAPKKCPICGKEFTPGHGRIYCSDNCKDEVYRRKHRKTERERYRKKGANNGSI